VGRLKRERGCRSVSRNWRPDGRIEAVSVRGQVRGFVSGGFDLQREDAVCVGVDVVFVLLEEQQEFESAGGAHVVHIESAARSIGDDEEGGDVLLHEGEESDMDGIHMSFHEFGGKFVSAK
jgi:hypothetical protein